MPRRDLILAGGGHSHALVIRQWGLRPLPGARLTLISPAPLTPYSGMLPGYLAGHYRHAEMHVDLAKLCRWAGVQLVLDCVTGIDTAQSSVALAQGSRMTYDLLSLDIGASPARDIPGVAEYAIPVKPIAGFINHWQWVLQQLRAAGRSRHLVMVGGGAGSVEALLAMAHAIDNDSGISHKPRFTLITRSAVLLPSYPAAVRNTVLAHCRARGITVLTAFDVKAVHAGLLLGGQAQESCLFDHLFWCTAAAAPAWLRHSGLALSERGFVRVDDALRSSNCSNVFASGDVAHFDSSPLPKAGVFAVRQAPLLYANLRHALGDGGLHLQNEGSQLQKKGWRLKKYRPQTHYLSLLALGGKRATGHRGPVTVSGAWVWHWKNWLDRRFMRALEPPRK